MQIKENINAPRHWHLCGEFTGDRWIPRTNGQLRGKCFHLMTSSCNSIIVAVSVKQIVWGFHRHLSAILRHLEPNQSNAGGGFVVSRIQIWIRKSRRNKYTEFWSRFGFWSNQTEPCYVNAQTVHSSQLYRWLTHWRYCSFALSHLYNGWMWIMGAFVVDRGLFHHSARAAATIYCHRHRRWL